MAAGSGVEFEFKDIDLEEIQEIIEKTFARWLAQNEAGELEIALESSGKVVKVDIRREGNKFNCGIPGCRMSEQHLRPLKAWVPQAIRTSDKVAEVKPIKLVKPRNTRQVNVCLHGDVMFNFHIRLW